jgi:undecaprenyl-diphosphatase
MGIIQGLSEFLPISSSGHIVIMSQLLKIDTSVVESDFFYTMILHLGTLVAVFIAFRNTIIDLIKDFFILAKAIFTGKFNKNDITNMQRMIICLIISLLPLIVVFPFMDAIDGFFSTLFPVGMALLINSIMLFFSDKIVAGKITSKNMGIKESVIIGIAQCIAVIPGISRSGSTITAGVASGLTRKYAAKYSFILSIPTILGGTLISFIKMLTSGESFNTDLLLPYVAGFIAAAITGFFAIKLLELLLKNRKFIVFSIYCLVLGTVTVVAGLIA